jgi:DNA-binding MarR family transcriptional regulator
MNQRAESGHQAATRGDALKPGGSAFRINLLAFRDGRRVPRLGQALTPTQIGGILPILVSYYLSGWKGGLMSLGETVAAMDDGHVVFGAVFAVANRLQRVLDQVMPEVTAKQWWLLVLLSMFDEPPTLGELAQAADTSHQNTRQVLDKLADKDFVKLVPDANDGRARRVLATAKVDEWGQATAGQARDFMAAMYAQLDPDELAIVASGLLRIHDALGVLDKEKE